MRVSMHFDDTACHQAAQLREDFGLNNNAQAVSVALAITAPLADALVKGEVFIDMPDKTRHTIAVDA